MCICFEYKINDLKNGNTDIKKFGFSKTVDFS